MDVQEYAKPVKQEQIKPAPYNPRIVTEQEYKGLKNSIDSFGDISGITFNRRNGLLVTGHHRYKAITEKHKELTFEHSHADKYRILGDGKYTGYDIRIVDWEEGKEVAANLAANSHTIAGSFDTEALSSLMSDIKMNTPQFYTNLNFPKLERDLGIYYDTNLGTNAVEGLSENASGSRNVDELLEDFLDAETKNLRLVINNEDYDFFISKSEEIMAEEGVDNLSDLFLHLVKLWDKVEEVKC